MWNLLFYRWFHDIWHNDIQHNNTHHNDIQHKWHSATITLGIIIERQCAECHIFLLLLLLHVLLSWMSLRLVLRLPLKGVLLKPKLSNKGWWGQELNSDHLFKLNCHLYFMTFLSPLFINFSEECYCSGKIMLGHGLQNI